MAVPSPDPHDHPGVDLADPDRLALITRLDLHGHLGDPDLDAVIATVIDACNVPYAVINIVTPGLQTYPAEAGIGASCTHVPDELSFCSEVVRTSQRLVVADPRHHAVFDHNPLVLSGDVGAYAGEPLVFDGQVIGVVSMFDAVPRQFSERDLQVLRAQARLAGAVIRLRALAAWDALTGLASRPLLLDRAARALAQARRTGEQVALLVLDVVDMGAVNEALGSAGGDAVLHALARRIAGACGPTDSVARIGGDEFAVLFGAVASREDARARAAAVQTAAAGPVDVEDGTATVTLRCGLTTQRCDSADVLLAAAERATAGGPSCEAAPPPAAAGWAQADELRRAIADEQLVLHYHPVIDLGTDRMVAVEALVRWQHPQRGLLSPAEFIGLAEQTGLIVELGAWVLRAGAAQAAHWARQGRALDVAINLSPRQLAEPHVAEQVLAVLQETGASRGRIVLEVTESALLDAPSATGTLTALREAGIRLALDDFGTGYSSLSYLRRFPIDMIKIDRSFVAGLGLHRDDDAIVASVVDLALNTGKSVIAEGVETLEHVALLRALGVQCAQGFLWTRPLPADQVLSWAAAFEQRVPAPRRPAAAVRAPDAVPPQPGSAESMVAAMHADGASLHTIAAALNSTGHRTDRGVRWHVRSVARVVAAGVRAPESLDHRDGSDELPGAVQRDQAGARRDDAAEQRDELAEHRDRAAERRDRTGLRRDRVADQRDAAGSERDDAADLRDEAAEERDQAADARDRLADARDRIAPLHRVGDVPGGGPDYRFRSDTAQRDAAADREQAWQDRQAGATGRTESEVDRDTSLRDRGRGATERGAAGLDRSTSWTDRGSGATERGQAGEDRSTALADRGASANDRRHASLDGLTGVYLRGTGELELEREVLRARRTAHSLVIAFVDVDHLKAVNDGAGHAVGDALLVRVADALRARLRPYDLIVRYGGDEFVCAMSDMSATEAADRFAEVNAGLAGGEPPGSVSVGLAELLPADTAGQLVARADQALYRQRNELRP